MKYIPPYGVTSNPNASYVNGDPSIGRQGSIPPAAVFENPQRELVNLITDSTQAAADTDLHQTTRAVRDGKLNFCIDSGPLNDLQVQLFGPPLQAYTAGLTLRVLVAHSNTGPTRITVGTLNPTTVKRRDGSELQSNDLLAGMVATLVCDGTYFQLQNMGPGDGTGGGDTTIYAIDIPYVHDTGLANHVIGLYSPPLPDIREGRTVEVKLAHNVTGPTDFTPNNFPTHPVTHPDGSPIESGDGVVNQVWLLVFDGVNWQHIACGCGGGVAATPTTPGGSGKSLQFYYGGGFPGPLNTMSHLQWTPPLNSNRQVWSYSGFIRRPDTHLIPDSTTPSSSGNGIEVWFSAGGAQAGGDYTGMEYYGSQWGNSMNLFWGHSNAPVAGNGFAANGNAIYGFAVAPVMNDTKWHHVLLNADGAFIYFYVDGVLMAKGAISGNGAINAARPHQIGADADDLGSWYGATVRMAELIFIDGYCFDWTKFANNIGGISIPKNMIGTVPMGPNSFYLNWNDSSAATTTTLGKDWSGRSNNFTPYNFSTAQVLADYPLIGAA